VPATWEVAIAAVSERLRPWDGRVAYVEAPRRTIAARARETRGLLRAVDDLTTLPGDLLDQADAEVFDAHRLDAPDGSFYRDRSARAEARITRFEPRWFVSRGPAVVAILHPREPAGSWTVEASLLQDGSFRIDLPDPNDVAWLSAELWRRRSRGAQADPEVLLGERSLRLYARPAGRLTGWLTERFPADAGSLAARLPPSWESDSAVPVRIYAWR
jgi:hypothetical protein